MESKNYTCCFCTGKFAGYGNSPYPLQLDGLCCNACHTMYVIPARFYKAKETHYNEQRDKDK